MPLQRYMWCLYYPYQSWNYRRIWIWTTFWPCKCLSVLYWTQHCNKSKSLSNAKEYILDGYITVNYNLALLRRIRKYLPLEAWDNTSTQTYNPILITATCIWGSVSDTKQVYKFQKRAVRLITDEHFRTHNIYDLLLWKAHTLIFLVAVLELPSNCTYHSVVYTVMDWHTIQFS